jgi:hypothetical protein
MKYRTKKLLVSAVMLLVPATIFAIPAKAETGDQDFLTAMHGRGISGVHGDNDLIIIGHQICRVRISGSTEQEVIDMLAPTAHGGLTPDDVVFMVKAAEHAYCPEGARLV